MAYLHLPAYALPPMKLDFGYVGFMWHVSKEIQIFIFGKWGAVYISTMWAGGVNLIGQCKKLETAVGKWEQCQSCFIRVTCLGVVLAIKQETPRFHQVANTSLSLKHNSTFVIQSSRETSLMPGCCRDPAALWSGFITTKWMFLLPPKMPVAIWGHRVRHYRAWPDI